MGFDEELAKLRFLASTTTRNTPLFRLHESSTYIILPLSVYFYSRETFHQINKISTFQIQTPLLFFIHPTMATVYSVVGYSTCGYFRRAARAVTELASEVPQVSVLVWEHCTFLFPNS